MNNHIQEILEQYITTPNTDHAILINGEWGSGKTYYFKNIIKPKLEKFIYSNDKKYKCIYVSLFGLSEIDEIMNLVIAEKFNMNNKVGRISLGALKTITGISSVFGFKDLNLKEISNNFKLDELLNLESNILCFDDLERISSKVEAIDVLGFINSNFVEHRKIKTIVICNEKEIKNKDEFKNKKEKLFERTVNFELNYDTIVEIIKQYEKTNKDFHKIINSNEDFIQELIKEYKIKNLRTILFYLKSLYYLYTFSDKTNFNTNLQNITLFVLIISNEFKEGKLNIESDDKKESIKKHYWVYSDDKAFALENVKPEIKYDESFYKKYLRNNLRYYKFYDSIYEYIITGYLNIELFKSETAPSEKPIWIEASYKIISFRDLNDVELQDNINNVKTYLTEGKYDLLNFYGLFELFIFLSKENIYEEAEENIFNFFSENFRKINFDVNKIDPFTIEQFNGKTEISSSSLKQIILKKINEVIIKSNKDKIETIYGIIKESKTDELKNYFDSVSNKELFHEIDLKKVSNLLVYSSNEFIHNLSMHLKRRYQYSDLKHLQKDKTNLVKLNNFIKDNSAKSTNVGKIKKYLLGEIIKGIENVTSRLN